MPIVRLKPPIMISYTFPLHSGYRVHDDDSSPTRVDDEAAVPNPQTASPSRNMQNKIILNSSPAAVFSVTRDFNSAFPLLRLDGLPAGRKSLSYRLLLTDCPKPNGQNSR